MSRKYFIETVSSCIDLPQFFDCKYVHILLIYLLDSHNGGELCLNKHSCLIAISCSQFFLFLNIHLKIVLFNRKDISREDMNSPSKR